MNWLCRLGLHAWRFTDWTDGDHDASGDACARPDCGRIRGTDDTLKVERVDSVVVPPEAMGAFFVPSMVRLVRTPVPPWSDEAIACADSHPQRARMHAENATWFAARARRAARRARTAAIVGMVAAVVVFVCNMVILLWG